MCWIPYMVKVRQFLLGMVVRLAGPVLTGRDIARNKRCAVDVHHCARSA